MAEAEERQWEIGTHNRERRPGTSQSGHKYSQFDNGRGGGDVLASKFEKLDLESDLSQFDKPKEKEYDDGRGEGGDVLARKDLDLSQFSWAIAKSFSSPCPFGETDEESCNGEEVYGDDEKSEDGYEVVAADTPWSYAIEDLREEVLQLPVEEWEQDRKEVRMLLNLLETAPFSSSSGLRPLPPIRKRIRYEVYVDAYFRRNRLPRYGILVKDPYRFRTFGYVGKSKSRKVPQLQTHLEGLLKGAKLVKSLISKKSHHDGELDICIFSNKPYVVDFASVTSEKPHKKEHFTQDVKTLLRDLILYTFQNKMGIELTSYFKNSPADYLARSPTSKLWKQIPKKDFDKELKDQIKLVEQYEAVKHRRREARSQKDQVKRSYLSALLSKT
ncbi:hypothetical protein MKW92_052748 [Papaver armeniacum]|nr:hypothetical protein MKW92_052748 [Papaver armeniacum]